MGEGGKPPSASTLYVRLTNHDADSKDAAAGSKIQFFHVRTDRACSPVALAFKEPSPSVAGAGMPRATILELKYPQKPEENYFCNQKPEPDRTLITARILPVKDVALGEYHF